MKPNHNKLWGGRFKADTHKQFEEFSSSISYDWRLVYYDIEVNLAYVKMLAKSKIISKEERDRLSRGLKAILKDLDNGQFDFDLYTEDIHTYIQNCLRDKVGDLADKLNTGRSRNDLVTTDMRLYCRDAIINLSYLINKLQKAVLRCADKYIDVIVPGYTHLQHAQLILLSHQLLSYLEMLDRDRERLSDAYCRVDVLSLGSGALAGTSLSIDRDFLARELQFERIGDNSIDAVSDRDFVMEILNHLSILSMHLSRISEDIILWSTEEFSLVELPEELCTGSSIMPQKKNPDLLELIRGYTGHIYGASLSLLVTMKGLPLSYNRDMQLDKQPLFHSIDRMSYAIELLSLIFTKLKVIRKNTLRNIEEAIFATDLAEYLVKKGVAFREAHRIIGKLIRDSIDKKVRIVDLKESELKCYSKYLNKEIYNLLSPDSSLRAKVSKGSTNIRMVRDQLNKWQRRLR